MLIISQSTLGTGYPFEIRGLPRQKCPWYMHFPPSVVSLHHPSVPAYTCCSFFPTPPLPLTFSAHLSTSSFFLFPPLPRLPFGHAAPLAVSDLFNPYSIIYSTGPDVLTEATFALDDAGHRIQQPAGVVILPKDKCYMRNLATGTWISDGSPANRIPRS